MVPRSSKFSRTASSYNDAVWGGLGDKAHRDEKSIVVRHGEPLQFGAEGSKALVWQPETAAFEVFEGAPSEAESVATKFDETNFTQSVALIRMKGDEFPVALGVLYCQTADARPEPSKGKRGDVITAEALQGHMEAGETWTVSDEAEP